MKAGGDPEQRISTSDFTCAKSSSLPVNEKTNWTNLVQSWYRALSNGATKCCINSGIVETIATEIMSKQ